MARCWVFVSDTAGLYLAHYLRSFSDEPRRDCNKYDLELVDDSSI